MARLNALWGAGLAAGAVGVSAAVVLLASPGLMTGVDPEKPGPTTSNARTLVHDVPPDSRSVQFEVEGRRSVGAVGEDPEARVRGREFDDAHIGDYVDPEGAVLPCPAVEEPGVADGTFQDPDYDLPLPAAHAGISEVGEYIDPEDAL